MSDFGTVTDYKTGFSIRPATVAEWRRTADKLASGDGDSYTGAWADENDEGRAVYVSGGPDADVSYDDISELRDEARTAGGSGQASLCAAALAGSGSARRECARVILDARMRAAEPAEQE